MFSYIGSAIAYHALLDDSLAPLTILKLQFEEALSRPDPKEGLHKLIDPRLGEDYPMDSVLKVREPRTG